MTDLSPLAGAMGAAVRYFWVWCLRAAVCAGSGLRAQPMWQRGLPGSTVDRLERLRYSELPVFETVGTLPQVCARARSAVRESRLAGSALGRWLESGIAGLSCPYAAVTGVRAVHVRLATVNVNGNACRHFHVDRLSVRLLCAPTAARGHAVGVAGDPGRRRDGTGPHRRVGSDAGQDRADADWTGGDPVRS